MLYANNLDPASLGPYHVRLASKVNSMATADDFALLCHSQSHIGIPLTLCIRKTPKRELLQTVGTDEMRKHCRPILFMTLHSRYAMQIKGLP